MSRSLLCVVGACVVLLLALMWLALQPRSVTEQQAAPLDAASSKAPVASEQQRGPGSESGRDHASAAQRIRARLLSSPLPDSIRPEMLRLATNPATGPGLKEFSEADLETLKRLYAGQTNLVARRPLTLALGFIGDEEVVELFKHALTVEHQGRQSEIRWEGGVANEEAVMQTTIGMLGFLAHKHDSAYSFLEKAIEPAFWVENASLKGASQFIASHRQGRPCIAERCRKLAGG